MKKKTLAGLISSLICISLIGVGFASWVIVGDDNQNSSDGTLVAEDISDNSVTITDINWGSSATTDATIKFTAAKNGTTPENNWLTNSSVAENDDLTATLTFKVTNFEKLNGLPTVTLADTLTGNSAYTAAIGKNVIKAPVIAEVKDNGSGNYSTTITFAWGTAFNEKNPYVFYNSAKASDTVSIAEGNGKTYKEHAKEYMPLVYALNNVTFKVTINATGKTA